MPADPSPIQVRPALPSDLPAIQRIYAHHVEHATGTFENTAPSLEEMVQRYDKVKAAGLPFLVACEHTSPASAPGSSTATPAAAVESDTQKAIRGYAYAGQYHTRPGWRFTLEDSVYVAAGSAGHGVGGALLAALIRACTEARRPGEPAGLERWTQMVAVIGGGSRENPASVRLHERAGFAMVGEFRDVGWKFGGWRDVALMQLGLRGE